MNQCEAKTIDADQPSRLSFVPYTGIRSLMLGACVAIVFLAVLYALQAIGVLKPLNSAVVYASPVETLTNWIVINLKGSLIPFAAVSVVFFLLVETLAQQLGRYASVETLAQTEYLADLCTSLFFGIGVIWTAIGMRSALLAGLGGLDSEVAAEVGAFAILQRLVDGGILLALSTTIVGGVGGYLMRVYKSLRIGGRLRRRYMQESLASEQAVLDKLESIHLNMQKLLQTVSGNATKPGLPE